MPLLYARQDVKLIMSDAAWVAYDKREEWADVTPIAQDDGPTPVVQIQYSAQCERPITS